MTTASMTKMSFRMFADFGAYLIRHPDKADLIPKDANVVFFTSKSPAFTAWSEARAADLKRRRQKVVTARQVGRSWRIASL